MAANEQTAPINREMRHLITSLQNHNGQLKGEVQRYKRKYKDTSTDNLKLRQELADALATLEGNKLQAATGAAGEEIKQENSTGVKEENSNNVSASGQANQTNSGNDTNVAIKEENHISAEDEADDEASGKDVKDGIKQEKLSSGDAAAAEKKDSPGPGNSTSSATNSVPVKNEKDSKDGVKGKDVKAVESETVRDLKAQLK